MGSSIDLTNTTIPPYTDSNGDIIFFGDALRHTANNMAVDNGDYSAVHNDSVLQYYSNATVVLQRPPLLKQSLSMVVILSIAYLTVFLLSVVNNVLVVMVIYRYPAMRTVTNYFLANLAVADITVSFIVLPITLLSNLFTEWQFGAFLCKFFPYLQAVAVSASVTTLAAVAVERYLAIFHPQKKIITSQIAVLIIVILWLIPLILQLPWALYMENRTFTDDTHQLIACITAFPSLDVERLFFLFVMFITCYIVPLLFLTVFYSMIGIKVWQRNVSGIRGSKTERNIQQQKIRIVRMLITVAVVFAVAWLPLYSIRMRFYYGGKIVGQKRMLIVNIFTPLAQWMGAATSAVNPFIYCYFSEQFRKYIVELLGSSRLTCLCGRRKPPQGSQPVPTNGEHTLHTRAGGGGGTGAGSAENDAIKA